jgi:glutamate-1-semialdehyde 2,1-aminomutase
VLIFDEIMTGFRTPQGTVQQATGVVPDLTVLGKALAAGMPLSVLVGRAAVLGPTMERLFYHPTFKSDAFSLAAAAAALKVYRSSDVAARLRTVAQHLKDGVKEASHQTGTDGQLVGLPYRMVYRFNDPDPKRRTLKRTLLQQELTKGGVLTFRGFLLPSLAHGEREVEETVAVFRSALASVHRVAVEDSFASALEIPLVI